MNRSRSAWCAAVTLVFLQGQVGAPATMAADPQRADSGPPAVSTAPTPVGTAKIRERRDALQAAAREGGQAHVLAQRWLAEREKTVPDAPATYATLRDLWRWRMQAKLVAEGHGESVRTLYVANPAALIAAVGAMPPTQGPPASDWERLSEYLAANVTTLERRFNAVATTLNAPELLINDLKAAAELQLLDDVLRAGPATAPHDR